MALFIRDPEVDALAEELRKITKVRSKTEAIRSALRAQLIQARCLSSLTDRMARAKAIADAMGPRDPSFDRKAFTDEMWGES